MQASTTFHAVDPRTGEPGEAFAEAAPEDVRAAVAAAAAAFRSGALADPDRRVALLRGAAARLRAAGDEIVAVCQRETGLPEPRLRGELERTAGQLEAFAAVVARGDHVEAIIDRADPDATPIPRPDVRRMLVPLGPVAVFGASNFPLAFSVAGGDTASALAAGCPVVVKGHPSHPGTSEVVARELRAAVTEAGLPEGTFALLQAGGIEVGETLVDDPEIAAVGFTGSYAAGRALLERATRRPVPIPVFAEMGSVNPVVVTEAALQARADAIAEGLTASVASFGGQLCTKPGVVFVPDGETGDAFVADVAARLGATEPQVMLNERLRDGLAASVNELAAHAERVTDPPGDGDAGPGFRFPPAAFRARATDLSDDPELLEERFGPVALFLAYASRDELLQALEAVGGQLTASVHAESGEEELLGALVGALEARAGRLVFDGFPTGVAVTAAMHHGGPFPATTAPAHTSVGATAIARFLRPVAFQNAPAAVLPPELRDENPRGIWRRVDGEPTRDAL
ncbi:MAG TPA: aldehyde dehydrogenase (NADP(+)) [Solirubrobacteraceae bacterium]